MMVTCLEPAVDVDPMELEWLEDTTVTVPLGEDVRLAAMPELVRVMSMAYRNGARRIELDVTRVQRMTEAARHILDVAASRLATLGVVMVLVDRSRRITVQR